MSRFLSSVLIALFLVGCATGNEVRLQKAVDNLDNAVLTGRKAPESALDAYEALYKKYPSNPITIGAYADALRRGQQAHKAALVLRPSVAKDDIKALPGPIFMSYIRLLMDQGYFKDAEDRLRKRMTLPAGKMIPPATSPQVSNLLGVALASQNRNDEARQAFQVALAHWDGRPGVVEKNLAQLDAKRAPKAATGTAK
jgi:Flp pilus assembly protein TadD